MKEPLVSRLLRYCLSILFLIGVFLVASLSITLPRYAHLYDAYYQMESYRLFLLLFLSALGVLALWIIAELILILRTISKNPFIRRNVRALRRIGIAAIGISLLFFIKCIYYLTFLTLVCGGVFLLCALLVFTLCALFAQAVNYKEENELTI